MPDSLQNKEESGGGTSEVKQPVDRTDRSEAPPRFREHDITVTERRVRSTGEIPTVVKRGQVARLPEESCPHRGLRHVRREKTRNGCKDDENICRSTPEGRPCPGPEPLQEVAEAEEKSGMLCLGASAGALSLRDSGCRNLALPGVYEQASTLFPANYPTSLLLNLTHTTRLRLLCCMPAVVVTRGNQLQAPLM